MPAFQLNGTFTLGESICQVLRVTGDHPDAVSEAAAPATVFLPVLFEASDRICAWGFLPSPNAPRGARHFGHRLLRQPEGVSGEHLAYSCRSCLEGTVWHHRRRYVLRWQVFWNKEHRQFTMSVKLKLRCSCAVDVLRNQTYYLGSMSMLVFFQLMQKYGLWGCQCFAAILSRAYKHYISSTSQPGETGASTGTKPATALCPECHRDWWGISWSLMPL